MNLDDLLLISSATVSTILMVISGRMVAKGKVVPEVSLEELAREVEKALRMQRDTSSGRRLLSDLREACSGWGASSEVCSKLNEVERLLEVVSKVNVLLATGRDASRPLGERLKALEKADKLCSRHGISCRDVEVTLRQVREGLSRVSGSHPSDVSGFPDVLRGLFEPLEFLGEGGFGRVWRVRRVSDGSVSAVKVPVISSPELGRVFLREVSVWLRLKHRNIVGLRDANVVPVPYLEMEFVPGATVDGKLVRCLEDLPKPVEPELAVKLFEGVAAAVAYAHSVGVIHRDLKPLNVLLDKGLTPKVSDWGLAKLAAMTTSRVGLKAYSPAYAAPEQIDEEAYGGTDERTDIYQLGLMLYELLTGRLPYEASTPAALTAKVVREDVAPDPPSKHSPELKPFDAPILKALSKRKELRYSRVEDLVRDVRKALRKYLSAAGEDLEAVRREVEEVKRTLRKSVRRGASREEVRALKARYAELLGKYAVAALREGEVEEAIEGLEELVYYTRKHEEELAKLIQEVEVLARSDAPITEGLIKRVKLLTAKIVAETRGGK